MFWMNLAYKLGFAVLINAGVAEMATERPLAHADLACSARPCVCAEMTPCPAGVCPQCPGQLTTAALTDAQHPICPAVCHELVPAAMAAQPKDQSMKQYALHIRFPAGLQKNNPRHSSALTVVARPNAQSTVSLAVPTRDGNMDPYRVESTVKECGENQIELTLRVAHMNGSEPQKYQTSQKVQLNTVTNVVLHNPSGEPYTAEVVVQRCNPVAHAMPMPGLMGCPFPHGPMTAPAFPPVCMMPPPMPVQIGTNVLPEPLPLPQPGTHSVTQTWTVPGVCCPPQMCAPHGVCPPAPGRPGGVVAHPSCCPAGVCPPANCPASCCPACVCPVQPHTMAVATSKVRTSHIHLVHEGDKARLKVESEGLCATCVRMCLDAGNGSKITVAAGKKRVHVSGKQWKASADHIAVGHDGHVMLSGNVHVSGDKVGVCASLKGQEVAVKLKNGKCEKVISTQSKEEQHQKAMWHMIWQMHRLNQMGR